MDVVSRDRYAVLFEPVHIGPVTTKNRFYQMPHCTGMGYAMPKTLAAMRAVKAEGGGLTATQRANAVWKQLLAEYEQSPMDLVILEAFDDYVARRKQTIEKDKGG